MAEGRQMRFLNHLYYTIRENFLAIVSAIVILFAGIGGIYSLLFTYAYYARYNAVSFFPLIAAIMSSVAVWVWGNILYALIKGNRDAKL